jgi:hypothetical protein
MEFALLAVHRIRSATLGSADLELRAMQTCYGELLAGLPAPSVDPAVTELFRH